MIAGKAIRQFLARERADYRRYKKMSLRELREERDQLRPRITPVPYWKKLRKEQRVCLLLGIKQRGFAFFLDTGMGKTLLSIALGAWFRVAEGDKHWLVLVPNKINKAEWSRELTKWKCKSKLILRGSSKQKWEQLRTTRAMFVVETYGGFVKMCCDTVPGKRGKNKLKPNKKKVEEIKRLFQAVVADESTNLQSKHSLAWRIVAAMGKAGAKIYALTGTPFGRDPTPLWGQLFLVDRGWTLGETLGLFRAAFFTEKRNNWGGFEYKFQKEHEAKLNHCLAHCSIRYEADKSTLPELTPVVRKVALTHEAEAYYAKAYALLRDGQRNGNFGEAKNGFLRMRQISSGWLGYKDDESGKRAEIEFGENPKLEQMIADIEAIQHKCIVFHDFIFSGSMVCRELSKAGIGWARISGETTQHEKILSDFDNPVGPPVLVLNNKFSMGPNLQAAKYGLYFELPLQCIMRKQGIRRFERQGSSHKKVFLYDYVTLGTVDQRILGFHAEGKDMFEAIINGKVRV